MVVGVVTQSSPVTDECQDSRPAPCFEQKPIITAPTLNPTHAALMAATSEAEQLYNQIRDVLQHPIDEIGFIVAEKAQVVVVEDKLGLTYPAAALVYEHAHALFVKLRAADCSDFEVQQELKACTMVMLVVNGNCYSAWNQRKRLVLTGICTVEEELNLAALIFTKHPKSSDGWAHRYCRVHADVCMRRM